MEIIKDFFDAASQRIRSPFFGYIALAFLALNWKGLFYLLFSSTSALDRIIYFEEHTDVQSLLLGPVVVGSILAMSSPYLSNFSSWWAEKPTANRKLREVQLAHNIALSKNLLLAELENERGIKERALVDQARVDAALEELDDEARDDVEKKISDVRQKHLEIIEPLKGTPSIDPTEPSPKLSKLHEKEGLDVKTAWIRQLSPIGGGRATAIVESRNDSELILDLVPSDRIMVIEEDPNAVQRAMRITRDGDILVLGPAVSLPKRQIDNLKKGKVAVFHVPDY